MLLGIAKLRLLPTTPRFIGDNEDAQSVAVAGFSLEL
jgi:hypothetical protein